MCHDSRRPNYSCLLVPAGVRFPLTYTITMGAFYSSIIIIVFKLSDITHDTSVCTLYVRGAATAGRAKLSSGAETRTPGSSIVAL